ncbi:MAG: Glycine--tRNA ligase beta subunit [Hyphomonas sp. TMED17]|nr:MAG: Glycine--tRNA ligase beta subunit [Hyphomonas sp. TMED17]
MARMTVGDQQTDIDDLLAFFGDRLKQYLRDAGMRHDLIDAVFGRGDDDLVSIVKRVEALNLFLDNEDGQNLLAGYKRAANILKAEEKKDGCTYRGTPEPRLFEADEEAELYAALTVANDAASEALAADDFTSAMAALSCLRTPLDNFFEAIIVNSDHSDVRHNRLLMLVAIRDGLHGVANFSLIAG